METKHPISLFIFNFTRIGMENHTCFEKINLDASPSAQIRPLSRHCIFEVSIHLAVAVASDL